MFQQWDKKKNGKLTKDEVPADAWQRFEKLGAVKGGVVTMDSIKAAFQKKQEEKKQQSLGQVAGACCVVPIGSRFKTRASDQFARRSFPVRNVLKRLPRSLASTSSPPRFVRLPGCSCRGSDDRACGFARRPSTPPAPPGRLAPALLHYVAATGCRPVRGPGCHCWLVQQCPRAADCWASQQWHTSVLPLTPNPSPQKRGERPQTWHWPSFSPNWTTWPERPWPRLPPPPTPRRSRRRGSSFSAPRAGG